MARIRAFQNPYLGRHLGVKNLQPIQQEQNVRKAKQLALVEKAVEKRKEIERTLDPKTGRARYGTDGTLHCVQMVDMLPWWRKLLVPFVGKYCEIGGVKYLLAGQTNIYYRAQEWIAGRARKSSLEIIGDSKVNG